MKKLKSIIGGTFFMCLIIFILSNCSENDRLIPLHYIAIPEYEDADYIKLLRSENPEIVYNSICQFIPKASEYATILSVDTIQDTILKDQAKQIFSLITQKLQSDDNWVQCSALRFYSNFGANYKDKVELAENLLQVNPKSKSAKLEFANAVKSLQGIDFIKFEPVAKTYFESKSWFISRYSFSMMPYLKSNSFFDYYHPKFNSLQEYDKLLFLSGLNTNYDDKVLSFLTKLIETEKSDKVKLLLVKSLSKANNLEKVNIWLSNNINTLSSISLPVSEFYLNSMNDTACTRILIFLYTLNYIPDSLLISDKSSYYTNYNLFFVSHDTIEENTKYLKQFYEITMKNPEIKAGWEKFKINNPELNYSHEFIDQQKILIESFKKEASKLYDQYKIHPNHKKHYIDRIDFLKNEFLKQ